MKIKDLIALLEKVDDKEQEIRVYHDGDEVELMGHLTMQNGDSEDQAVILF